jgi:hypothetical protein
VFDNTMPNCSVVECVREAFTTLKFPKPEGGIVSVTYPIMFDSRPPPPRDDPKQCKVRLNGGVSRPDFPGDHGRMDPAQLRKVVKKKFSAMRACYDRDLEWDPKLQGRVEVFFEVAQDGTVPYVEVAESTLPRCDVVECVRDVFRSLKFPRPQGGIITVQYPLAFEPDVSSDVGAVHDK